MNVVPNAWAGETAVILATGPSLTPDDVEFCRSKAKVLAIKEAVLLAPWADALYAADSKWWRHFGDALTFTGPKYSIENHDGARHAKWAIVLRNTGELGLEIDPTGLRTGRNSGYQAINLAVHLGAKKIVLLGYDMQDTGGKRNWFPPRPPSYSQGVVPWHSNIVHCWPSIVAPLQTLGIAVINATRTTALDVFPQMALEEALA